MANQIPNTGDVDYTDMDPQSARASQGVNTFLDSGLKTADSVEPESSPVDAMILGAVAPVTGRLAEGAGSILGNEIGAIGADINSNEITDHALGGLQKAQQAFKAGTGTNKDVAFAQQKFATAQRIAQRNGRVAPTSYAEAPVVGDAKAVADSIAPKQSLSALNNAKQMGFDTSKTYYHGTINPVEAFSNEYSDPDNWYGKGTYLTSKPESASTYATRPYDETSVRPGGNVIPTHVAVKNTLDLDKPINNPAFSKALMAKLEENGDAKAVANQAKKFPQIPVEQHAMQYMPAEDVTTVAQEHGYDSIKHGDILNVFDPKHIRSKFAQFDPKQANSSMLSYADGGQVAPEPDGLDAFLSGGAAPQALPQMAQTQSPAPVGNEPPGLDEFIAPEQQESDLQDKYGSTNQQILSGVEGAAQGVAGPLATAGLMALGDKPEDMRGREQANPWISHAGQIAGLGGSMMMGVGEGRLLLKTGELASNLVKGSGLAAKVGMSAADGAIQNMLLAGGDEVTKAMRSDPDSSMQAAVTNIGLSGLLGGSIGGALGTVSPLWKASFGDRAGQVVEDFKNRVDQHINNPDMAGSVAKELSDHWESTNMVADPVYGHNGLKAQEISKAMPEFHEGMTEQASDLANKLQDSVNQMNAKPNKYPPRFADKLNDVAMDLNASLSKAESPADIFNSIQTAKQNLQTYAKFDKMVTPVDEGHGFVQMAKSLQHDFRTSLEDQGVWGKAAKAQQDINSAATDFFKSSKDFQSKFTSKVQGEPIVDAAKVNTYINQLGKPNAEIKSTVLKNYLDASETYRNKISDIHNNLGIDNPVQPTSLNATMQTFDKPTTGSKLADVFIEKGLTQAGGKGIGAAIGAMAGSKAHFPGSELLGTMLGAHILGPFISSILPLIAKPILSGAANSLALKSASDAGYAMIRGNGLVDRATKALFASGKDVIPVSMIPNASKLARLDKMILAGNNDPNTIAEGPTNISGYLPDHGQAASMIGGSAVNYLKSIRPDTDSKAPLDPKRVPSKVDMANYNRQLANAEQPLMILNRIKDGTVNSKDLMTLQTIYPNLYKSMATKIMDEMTNHLSKGKVVPYTVRIGLSKFAAQPLDSTMSPMSIMAAQPQQPQQQPPGEQQGSGKPRKGAGGTSLNKLSSSYQTQSQSLSARHEKND